MGETLVTVAVPLLDEAARLPGLLAAILAQDYPRDQIQVVLVDGGSQDGTREVALEASRQHTFISVLHNRRRVAAAGLNCALDFAGGEWRVPVGTPGAGAGEYTGGGVLLRLDARTRPAPDYVSACVRALGAATEWAGVGGPQVAAGASPAACTHALALNHPFGVGGPAYRRATQPALSDTIYLGAYPVVWLRRASGWDEAFAYNEDYELNARLREAGGKLLVDPAIHAHYLARDSLGSLAAQYFHYGRWRTLTIRQRRRAWRWRHLAPALLPALLFLAALAAIWTPWPLIGLMGVYTGLDLAASLQIILSRTPVAYYETPKTALGTTPRPQPVHFGFRALPRLFLVFPLLHLSWGGGFWFGVVRRPGL